MKRRRGEEEDLSELLQFLDNEATGPSTAVDNYTEPELEPKHKIFLSHSGVQKDFTEQLCVDLERSLYYPFFDKRPDSLPKGRKFPELIFQAAQQCHVAILILSEEFFTHTKWPMLELEAFVQAHKQDPNKIAIFPVYFGISRDECTKNEARCSEWVSLWREWAKTEERIDVEKWVEALRVLGPSNGIEYVKSLGEVALREQIVSALRNLVQPEKTWSAGQIEGRTRICKALIEKFRITKPSPVYGVRVVGIHGVGGVGKTTFCKVLCDELYTKFRGRVCHGELGIRSAFELQKQVLRDLADINHSSLAVLSTEDMTTNLLKRRIYQQQVFLALDNVSQQSIEEAKVYLRAGFHDGSIVMVTARSIDLLHCLNIDKRDCFEMPELDGEDAKHLFLQHAAPGVQYLRQDDKERIFFCLRQCKFRKGANMDEHFHPLALKVLGAQLGSLGLNPKMWVENLSKKDKFNQFGEKEHPIFSVLRRSYDSLLEEDQLLFMDSVLFHPSQVLFESLDVDFQFRDMCHMSRLDIYEWLSIVHQTEVGIIKNRLQGLKAKSLLEDIGDNFYGVSVHDLYLEFAKLEVKRDDSYTRRWMWYNREEAYPNDLAKRPFGNCWGNLERVLVKYNANRYDERIRWRGTVEGIKWHHFSNVVVLQLLIGINEVVDLQELRCLRSLELKWGDPDYYCCRGEGKLIGLGELRNLGWLELRNIHYAPCFEEIGRLTALEVLRLHTNCARKCKREALPPPKLDNCIHLREVVLRQCVCLTVFPDMSKLMSLRTVFLEGCTNARVLVGLTSQMCALRELSLILCTSLCHITGLGDLVTLQELCVVQCNQLRYPLNVCKLTNLQRLSIEGGYNEILGFSESMMLRDLVVGEVEELRDLHLLRNLQRLSLNDFSRSMLPRFDNFTALEELILTELREVRELPDVHKLSRLRRLTINSAPKLLLQLPMLGDLVALEYLSLKGCGTPGRISEVSDLHRLTILQILLLLPDLHMLTNLQVLLLGNTLIRSLPSLKCLTQLRIMCCNSTKLAVLPDLTGLILLERINLSGCHELTSVGNLANLPALEYFNLGGCYRLERMPDLRSFKRLRCLILCHSRVRLSSEDITALAALLVSDVFICDHFQLNFLKMLETMPLTKVVMKIKAKQLEFSAKPRMGDWEHTDSCSRQLLLH